jgi:2-C-methyl-D-erythritol 4-phosphate cytidylyltransferase
VASKVTSVVTGGDCRAASVQAALAQVPQDALVVLVHDAARPLVGDEVIERVLAALGEGFDGAVPGLPVADTLKRVERGVVAETLERSHVVAVQTPQAFTATALRTAFAGELGGATDCASLVERIGGRVRVVEGDPRLLKVTTPDDLELVERLLAGD